MAVSLRPVVVVEQIMKVTGYLNISTNRLSFYIVFVIPNGDEIFDLKNTPYHKIRIGLKYIRNIILNSS